MVTKILYVVGEGSTHENIELKWSLRSLEKHAMCDVEPVIVGNVPSWFKGNAVPCDDTTNRKEKNIMRKIFKAIEYRLVEDVFQISADDHFWLRPVDIGTLPVYYRQDALPGEVCEGGNNYEKALVGTRKTLEWCGYSFVNTTVHCNQWCDARTALQVRMLEELSKSLPDGRLAGEYGLVSWAVWPNVAMGNRLGKPLRHKRDIKVRKEDFRTFMEMIKEEEVCSINDCAFETPEVYRWFSEAYQGKSRWER